MIAAAESGTLSIEKLEAMTAVCSVGLDMIIIPGDTSAEVISGIIADEAAIGMVNSKTTAVRVIPAIGKKIGDTLNFGGLLGYGPVMAVNTASPEKIHSPRRSDSGPDSKPEKLNKKQIKFSGARKTCAAFLYPTLTVKKSFASLGIRVSRNRPSSV